MTHPGHSHARSFHHNRARHDFSSFKRCFNDRVFRLRDFPVASSAIGVHYAYACGEFNIKCHEYFDLGNLSYLGWYE
jgi:hypothetical protein